MRASQGEYLCNNDFFHTNKIWKSETVLNKTVANMQRELILSQAIMGIYRICALTPYLGIFIK
ncbi:hypothetical protein PAHAL_7G056200 [Panicum hallii]|uniref:Uncharacterized protein n=1 Tax=Panicum hallii TaxID=206008 RepID=A0A2T8IB48_9POAL|nr:hypothetical protein PAHAL_7G056200 [Panicum hallii]